MADCWRWICGGGLTVAKSNAECLSCGESVPGHANKCPSCGSLVIVGSESAIEALEAGPGRLLTEPWQWTLEDCTVLGGCGFPLVTGWDVALVLSDDAVLVVDDEGEVLVTVTVQELREFELGGPGAVTTGGGFGFLASDVQGFLNGVVASSVLNLLTTRTTVHTIIRLRSTRGELFLHHGVLEPAALRIVLSPLFFALAGD